MGARSLPIIVGGALRSGTTLVRRLLDSHSRIHCGPEIKFFRDFYGNYLNDDHAHVRLFASARKFGFPETELLALFGGAFVAMHERAATIAGKPRWADKNPENVLYLRDWHTLLPDGFLFVHVVRNPFDVLASLNEADFHRTVPTDFRGKVEMYRKFRQAGDAYCLAHVATSHTLSYEQLAAEPEKTVTALLGFLGEDYEPNILTEYAAPERGSGIEDPKVRKTLRIHTESVGRWRRDLSDEEHALAQEILAAEDMLEDAPRQPPSPPSPSPAGPAARVPPVGANAPRRLSLRRCPRQGARRSAAHRQARIQGHVR